MRRRLGNGKALEDEMRTVRSRRTERMRRGLDMVYRVGTAGGWGRGGGSVAA